MSSSGSNIEDSDYSKATEHLPPYEDQYEDNKSEDKSEVKSEDEADDYEFTEEEKKSLCRAFTILDIDGDGVIELSDLDKLLLSWGRMPMGKDLIDILSYSQGEGCEGATGMDFYSFQKYIKKQLANTTDEEELRKAFEVFDSCPATGKLNLTELRHFLKHKGMKLNDDEIDFLFKEEDYWMLEEKNIFEYEQLINKLLDKSTCNSPFLNC